jgi:hypothetical protein
MSKNKKWLLALIIIFPSAFWVILELSTINSKKLPYFGPKTASGKDTNYYSTGPVQFFTRDASRQFHQKLFDTVQYPILVLSFVKPEYSKEGYRIAGLLDYTQYKKNDIEKIPVLLLSPADYASNQVSNLKDSLKIDLPNIEQCYWNKSSFDSLNRVYFRQKPYYIDYSFFVLLDKKRRIRGFYDGRYVAEIKRFLGEYKHLRIKEEKNLMLNENEIHNNVKN